jgi:predicted unusual protein kinase regulating ubiquinone biosynthesis (AarF/ABC1/UbiB family)
MATRNPITTGRARRAIKMGGLASQVGTSYLWTSIRRPFLSRTAQDRELLETHIRNAERILESSKHLRGAFMKLIQMLSMRQDLLPGEALDVLRTTQSSVPPMSYGTIAEQVRREIGQRPEQLFRTFDHTAFAAASLGQVHRARLKDGREVAVKVQYPGVEATVEEDLKNMKLLLRTLQAIGRDVMRQKVDTAAIYAELEARLREELDYVSEARNMQEFGRLLADDREVEVPAVVKELRTWVANKCHALVWRQILEFGVLHTDFHPGNYLVNYHPRLGILDFGSIRRFRDAERRAYLQVARGIIDDDARAIGAGMQKLGWLDRAQNAAPMVKIVRILFAPMMVDRDYDPKEYDTVGNATQVGEIAFEHKLYKSPAHSVFLLRALIGLEGIIRHLGVKTNYRRIFKKSVEHAEAAARGSTVH